MTDSEARDLVLQRLYPAASLLFDAAVAEDIKKFGPTADKPALLFMRLEDKDQEVLLRRNVFGPTEHEHPEAVA